MPICTYHGLQLGFTSHSAAAEEFKRLRERKYDRLIPIGQTMLNRTGRPTDVFFNGKWTIKQDNLRHEVKITDYQLAMGGDFVRGPNTGELLADFVQDGMLGEMDCGTMSKQKVIERWMKYESHQGPILVVVAPLKQPARERVLDLINWAEEAGDFNDKAYYTALDAVVKEPQGAVWIDCSSRTYTLETIKKNAE